MGRYDCHFCQIAHSTNVMMLIRIEGEVEVHLPRIVNDKLNIVDNVRVYGKDVDSNTSYLRREQVLSQAHILNI